MASSLYDAESAGGGGGNSGGGGDGGGGVAGVSGGGGGKSCCGVMVTQTVSIRWFIIMIAFVGICCAVVGTVLGAMRSSGREHLTVSLLMIGNFYSIVIPLFHDLTIN